MNKFSKKDLVYSIITGLTTGFIAWQIFDFLDISPLNKGYGGVEVICGIIPPCFPHYAHYIYIPWAALVVIVPIVWIIGINLGYLLGRWFGFFNQFGKYAAVGFTNAAVDFGVLNLLIALSGTATGLHYSLFKTTSFVVAVFHSYFWNKHWAFESTSTNKTQGEFFKFIVINVIVAAINIGVASLVVNYIHPAFGLNANTWANVGAVIGSAAALIFNFVGFRLIVFKKNESGPLS